MSRIFPVFIPHLGCPHQCVFCDQKTIASNQAFDIERIEHELVEMLANQPIGKGGEIAFFGGSFTGIDQDLIRRLLSFAGRFVAEGKVDGIRFSTRPDYISEQVLDLLSPYPIKTIELGIQSLCDRVLTQSGRGHTSQQSLLACKQVKQAGYDLIGQMMIGLPYSTPEDEKQTAEMICQLGADGARIYPTVVFPNTPLSNMVQKGTYRPLSIDEAVCRCADAFEVFQKHSVPVIRIGLCSTEQVRKDGEGYHDAIGELAMGEVYRRAILRLIQTASPMKNSTLTVYVSSGHTSLAIGHKRKNKIFFEQEYGVIVRVLEDPISPPFSPLLHSITQR